MAGCEEGLPVEGKRNHPSHQEPYLHLFTRSVLETVQQVGAAIITDRGRPIAKIVALDPEEAELIQAGGTLARPRFGMPTRRVPADRPSATEALLAMRADDDHR